MSHNQSINGYKQSLFGGKNALEMTNYEQKQNYMNSVADQVNRMHQTTGQRREAPKNVSTSKFNHTSFSSSRFFDFQDRF